MAAGSSGGLWAGRDAKIGGVCGILTGVLLVAGFGAGSGLPYAASQADQTLANFSSLRTAFLIADGLIALLAIFGIPYFASMRTALKGRSALLANASAAFSTVGVVLLAVQFLAETVSLGILADVYARGGAERTTAVILAELVISLTAIYLFAFSILVAGFGIFGYLMVKSKTFPNWVGYLGIFAGILTVAGAVPVTIALAFYVFLGGFLLIIVWMFASSAFLFRSATQASTGAA